MLETWRKARRVGLAAAWRLGRLLRWRALQWWALHREVEATVELVPLRPRRRV